MPTTPAHPIETVEVLFAAEAIADRIGTVAQRIAEVGLERLLVVAILKGSFVFAADLLRAMHRAGLAPDHIEIVP